MEGQVVMVVDTPKSTGKAVAKDVGTTVKMGEVSGEEIGGITEIILSSTTHQLHPPGQAGVEAGGVETATGTTPTRISVVGTDRDISENVRGVPSNKLFYTDKTSILCVYHLYQENPGCKVNGR